MGLRTTKLIGMFWGESFPFYYVSEYPRSGGNWLGGMIADYLRLPFPSHSVFPYGCAAVLHNHWGYSPRLRRVYYIFRDGRDVCLSMYFFCLRGLVSEQPGERRYYAKRLGNLQIGDITPANCALNLPEFIRCWVKTPFGCKISWADHVKQWAFDRPNVVPISYEQLSEDCEGALARILPAYTNEPVERERLRATIEKFSFQKISGRQRGKSDPFSFYRKGIVGDWRNHFTRSAGEVFHQLCGQTLIDLGYEQDASWLDELSDVPASRSDEAETTLS